MNKLLEKVKKNKLKNLNKNPFLKKKFKSVSLKKIIKNFSVFDREELIKKNKRTKISGRITRIRNFGKLIFIDLLEENEKIQLKLKLKEKDYFSLDIGDIIGVEGIICKTNKGELTIEIEKLIILSKCLKNIPDLYYGLNNQEERFRKRYFDFIVNPEERKIFLIRHKISNIIREFLNKKNFIEFETPILVSEASGAQAEPFITYHKKHKKKMYLRIATEIQLKMLIIGGFNRIYEFGRVFRNEGIDKNHNPEFTTIEIYKSFEDSRYMMKLTEKIFHNIGKKIKKSKFNFNSENIDISKKFSQITMIESVKNNTGIDFKRIKKIKEALKLANDHNLKIENFHNTIGDIIVLFFEKYVEKKLIQPTFILDHPIETSPLAKRKRKKSNFADRFELYIGGLEFANGYSELNDSIEQEERFVEQNKKKELGNKDIANYDKEFIESLKYGMPPTAGLGIGIDRLIMFFAEKSNIREVIAFPTLKNKEN